MKCLFYYFSMLVSMAGLYSCNMGNGKSSADKKNAAIDSGGVRFQLVTNAIPAPVQLTVVPDTSNRIFITDHDGKIWIMKNDSVISHPFFDITATPAEKKKSAALGTINSIAIHPRFATNHKFYVCYNAPTSITANQTKMVVDEFTAGTKNADIADAKSRHRVFELEGKMMYTNGAEIAFGPDGYLYISIGDDAFGDTSYQYHAQDLNYFNGKLLRIDINKAPYAIPPDNPFAGMKDKKPEIWAYGFRKMWRFVFDARTRQMFGADVGEEKQEEIDIVKKGGNYGWPVMEGDSTFKKDEPADSRSFIAPINAYTHIYGICVIGGSFYYGKDIPLFRDKYVFGDFNGSLFTLTNNANGKWTRDVVKVFNKPAEPFLLCALNTDKNNQLYAMGFLNSKAGQKGAIYKIIKNQ
jgi:glucose/arabinose dehydrogenase